MKSITKSHSRLKCMRCNKRPVVEVLWAEGMAQAWFCAPHMREFSAEQAGEINDRHPLAFGVASENFNEGPPSFQQAQDAFKATFTSGDLSVVTTEPSRKAPKPHIGFEEDEERQIPAEIIKVQTNKLGLNALQSLQEAPFNAMVLQLREDIAEFKRGRVCGSCRFYLRDPNSAIGQCQLLKPGVEVPWWWTSHGYINAQAEAKETFEQLDNNISFMKAENHSGVMLSLPVPPDIAKKISLTGGIAPEDMHITMAYFGKSDVVDPDTIKKIRDAAKRIAARTEPIHLRLNGIGRFVGKQGEDDPLYANADSPQISELKRRLDDALKRAGVGPRDDHGFTAHVTMAYLPKDEDTPQLKVDEELDISTLAFSVGNDVEFMRFGKKPLEVNALFVKELGADEERYTFGVVYKATNNESDPEEDAHDEFITADDLQKSLWEHVREGDRSIFVQHGLIDSIGFKKAGEWVELSTWPYEVTEEFVLPGQEPETRTIPAGSAWMGIIWEPWAWEAVKAGKIRGLSFGGTAKREVA